MDNHIFNHGKAPAAKEYFVHEQADRQTSRGWNKYHAGALIGLPGGILVLLGAIFLNVFDLVAGDKPHGIWLFVAAYPLFALGAHCLDKLGEMKKAEKKKAMSNLKF